MDPDPHSINADQHHCILGQYFNADSDGDPEEAAVKPAKPTSPAAGNKSAKSPAGAAATKPAKRGRKAVGRGRPPGGGGGRPRETDESSDSEVSRDEDPDQVGSVDF